LRGFHKRDAGGRGGVLLYSERKLRLKRRLVMLQRAGGGDDGGSCADGRGVEDEGSRAGGSAVVRAMGAPGREMVTVVLLSSGK
jgi:hypothetical protein